MGHEKAGWKVAVCVGAHGKNLLTPQRKHMRAQPPPSIILPSPLYRLPGQQERDTRRHVEEKGRRRAGAGGK